MLLTAALRARLQRSRITSSSREGLHQTGRLRARNSDPHLLSLSLALRAPCCCCCGSPRSLARSPQAAGSERGSIFKGSPFFPFFLSFFASRAPGLSPSLLGSFGPLAPSRCFFLSSSLSLSAGPGRRALCSSSSFYSAASLSLSLLPPLFALLRARCAGRAAASLSCSRAAASLAVFLPRA